jgi:hypothetical protein
VEIKKAHRYLWTPVLSFSPASRHFQAHVIKYDDIFHALAAEGDFLFPKPFLYFGLDGVMTR